MANQAKMAKARLVELDANGQEISAHNVEVQFNPETLKISYANQLAPPEKGKNQDPRSTTATQFVGRGTTKLTVQLWFDVTSADDLQTRVNDVRLLTKEVIYFITAHPSATDKNKEIPPGVRFQWGSFQFDGIMESLDESLEFFSPEGRPLRASMTLNMSQQSIRFTMVNASSPATPKPGSGSPGTQPLTQVAAGATLQSLTAGIGANVEWQKIASANGIEDPRNLAPGTLLDLNIGGAGSIKT
jgi:hypothetical protein